MFIQTLNIIHTNTFVNHKDNYVYFTITKEYVLKLATLWTIDLTWNEIKVGYQAGTVCMTSDA